MPGRSDCRIYVGNLPPDVRESELEDLFYKYGKINYIDLKVKRGSYSNPFAFIEFDDWRDADDAVYRRDGYNFDGYKLRVEYPHSDRGRAGGGGSSYGGGGSSYGGGGSSYRSSGSSYSYGGGRSKGPPLRSGYRVFVTGLPFSGSWQDLKDHLREAGDVCFADVFKDGTGVAEFVYKEDMRWAIRELDDTKFRSHEGDSSYIRIREDIDLDGDGYYSKSKGRRSLSRSYSRSRSHSRSLTPSSHGSRSRSRSRSFSRSVSRSRSRSLSPKSKWSRYSRSRSSSRSRSPGGGFY